MVARTIRRAEASRPTEYLGSMHCVGEALVVRIARDVEDAVPYKVIHGALHGVGNGFIRSAHAWTLRIALSTYVHNVKHGCKGELCSPTRNRS